MSMKNENIGHQPKIRIFFSPTQQINPQCKQRRENKHRIVFLFRRENPSLLTNQYILYLEYLLNLNINEQHILQGSFISCNKTDCLSALCT